MKRKILFTAFVLSFLLSCKQQESGNMFSEVIDIEHSLQNLTTLKTSDFGKTIRFIPLETTDDGLVGRDPVVKVVRDYIVIESQRTCLLFDKNNGRFITEIGRIGQGPEEYTNIFSWVDEKEEFLFFQRGVNQLIKYDMQGKYGGKVDFFYPQTIASWYLLSDSEIIGYFGGPAHQMQFSIGFFDKEGVLVDSVPRLIQKEQIIFDEILNMTVLRGNNPFGNWARAGSMVITYKNDTKQFFVPNVPRVWRHNENIRYKEEFVDTVYTLSNRKLVPTIAFNTGKYSWTYEESRSGVNTNERIYIADVSENDNLFFFQCVKGMYADEPILYHGLYDKKTGETKVGKFSDGIEDDLTRFMPFIPSGMSTAGEFVALVEAYNIIEWLEKHPEAKDNDKLEFLKELDEEGNPIIILIK